MMLKKVIILSALAVVSTSVCFADESSNVQTFEVDLAHFHYGYSEIPGGVVADSETAWMNGVHLSYKNQDPATKQYWKIAYDQTNQNTNYNGYKQDANGAYTIPWQTITNDKITNTEITFGNPVSDTNSEYVYTGVGFHNWDRNITGSGGYLEQYSWGYIPVGYRSEYRINNKWGGALDVAAKFMFDGQMNASPLSGTFNLGSKVGFKAELPYTYKADSQWSMILTPWYEYSGISQSSNSISGYVEPDSMTHQYGVDVGISYTF